MRILTVGAKMMANPLRAYGHEVMTVGPIGSIQCAQDTEMDFLRTPLEARAAIAALHDSFRPDWILQLDDSTPLPHLGLEALSARKAWYAVDTHLHWEWHRHYAPLFDVVFCAQKNRIGDLGAFRTEAQSAVAWLPLFFTGEPSFLPWSGRRHESAFVGTLNPALNPERIALLEGLAQRGMPVHVAQGECDPVYRQARVVINQSARDDLNLRFFEAMGNGALLITDRISHSLEDFGEPGRDFLVYAKGDAEGLSAQVRWAREHPAEAEAMARRSHAKVVAAHRMSHRLDRLLETLARPVPDPAPRGRVLAHLAKAHEHLSRLEFPGPLVAFFASEARRLAEAALACAPREAYALLALALLDLEKGEHAQALAWLDSEGGRERAPEYRRRYLFLKALLLAHTGRLDQARLVVRTGLLDFPGEADLLRLDQALGR
jgi:hypothetical protein